MVTSILSSALDPGTVMTEILALIPARGGSKGIPGKNIRDFAGYPLIAWSIAAAKQSELVTRVIVSTDDEESPLSRVNTAQRLHSCAPPISPRIKQPICRFSNTPFNGWRTTRAIALTSWCSCVRHPRYARKGLLDRGDPQFAGTPRCRLCARSRPRGTESVQDVAV